MNIRSQNEEPQEKTISKKKSIISWAWLFFAIIALFIAADYMRYETQEHGLVWDRFQHRLCHVELHQGVEKFTCEASDTTNGLTDQQLFSSDQNTIQKSDYTVYISKIAGFALLLAPVFFLFSHNKIIIKARHLFIASIIFYTLCAIPVLLFFNGSLLNKICELIGIPLFLLAFPELLIIITLHTSYLVGIPIAPTLYAAQAATANLRGYVAIALPLTIISIIFLNI